MLRKFILATTFLVPLTALADDDFGISDEPAKKEAPVTFNTLEMGLTYGTDNPLTAYDYSGRQDGGALPFGSLNYLYRSPWGEKTSDFLRITGSSSGTDARRLAVEGGEQGSYKLSFGYDALPFNDFAGQTPFDGEGGANLALVPGWTRAVNAAGLDTAQLKPVDIRTQRERFGSGLTWHIDPQYSLRVGARHEEKEGARTLGVAPSGAMSVIAPAPVNYQDDRVETELAYAGRNLQWRLGYQLSLFRNEDDSLALETPFTVANHPRDRAALAPDNTAHSVFADGGYQFTDTTRLTTNLSYSQYLQDETFLPYSANMTSVTVPMPRQSLEGRIATTTANVELTTRPLARLDVKTRYRFTDRRNDTPVSQFQYYLLDGTGQGATEAFKRRNTPFSYKENLASADFGYGLTARTKLQTGYEFRTFQRSHSERAKDIENTGHVGIRSNLAEGLSGHAKYSRTWRDGSTYSPRGSLAYSNTPLVLWDNNPLLRKYYEADLVRDRVQTGLTYSPTEALSLGVSGGVTVDEYVRSELGLSDAVGTHASIDANYILSPDLSLNGFYTYERRTTDQAGWTGFNGNPQNRWYVNIADDAHTVGLGGKYQVREGLALMLDYAFVWTVSEVDPTRDPGSTANPAAASFPDITSKSHAVSLRAEYDLTERLALGFGYALELYRSKDWALDDMNPNSNSILSMAEQSANYDAHLFLVSTRYKF